MRAVDTNVSGCRIGRWASLGVALLALAAVPAASAQTGASAAITQVTPPITPVTPPAIAPSTAIAPPFGTSAIVLVGGFNSSSPFTTPACAATDRGPTWGQATGPAAALSAAGLAVFTVPIANAGEQAAPSCLGGRSTPDIPHDGSLTIDSNGAMPGNQQALVGFLGFLHSSYGITSVQLVGHSDGGLWSRAAITQLRSGGSPIAVTNLTTVGTPHIGSFGADLAEALNGDGGSCSDLSGLQKDVCQLIFASIGAIIDQLGSDVIEELSASWLAQWNPTTSIGCPVTTLAGDHVGWNIGLGYYSPNDGIVGQASALNQSTLIPALRAAPFVPVDPPGYDPPTFDVVHSPSLSFLSPNNELNTQSVSNAIVASVRNPPSSACAQQSALRTGRPRSAAAHATVATGGSAARRVVVSLPMRSLVATRSGTLRRPRSGDAILLRKGASVRCAGKLLPAVPLLGSARVRVVVARCSRPVRVHGRALQLKRAGTSVRLTRDGRSLRWRVTGGRLRRVHAQLRVHGRWRTLKGSRTIVPSAESKPALRVSGVDRAGRTVRTFTRLAP